MIRFLLLGAIAVVACKGKDDGQPSKPGPTQPAPDGKNPERYDKLSRFEVNRIAVRLNLPLYWVSDADGDKALDPEEVATLRFYPTSPVYVEGGKFTAAFEEDYRKVFAGFSAPRPSDSREILILEDLDGARPTLVHTKLGDLPAEEKAF